MTDPSDRYVIDGHPRRWLILAILNLCLVLIVASVSSLNVAIPTDRPRARGQPHRSSSGSSTPTPWSSPGSSCPPVRSATATGARARCSIGLAVFGTASCVASFADSPIQLIGCGR